MADPASSASLYALMASWFTPSSLFLFLNLVIGTIALASRFGTPKRQTQHPELGPQLARSSSLLDRVKSFNFGLCRDEPTFAETEFIQPAQDSPQLVRTPSLLERLKSFNFGHHRYEPETEYIQPDPPEYGNPHPNPDDSPQPPLARAPSLLERLKSINFSHLYRSDSTEADKESEAEVDAPEPYPDQHSGHGWGNLVGRSTSETHKESTSGPLPEKMKKSASEKSASRESGKSTETASLGEDDGVDAKADDFINRFKQQLRLQRLDSIIRNKGMLKGC